MQLFCFFDGMCHIQAFDVHLKLCPKRTSRSKHIPVTLKTRINHFIIIRGSFLLRFEQVFGCRIYFNSVYIITVGMMLFNSFLADVNLDFFNILQYSFDKVTLCIVTKIQRFQDFNFLIKVCHISWLAPYFCDLSALWFECGRIILRCVLFLTVSDIYILANCHL